MKTKRTLQQHLAVAALSATAALSWLTLTIVAPLATVV